MDQSPRAESIFAGPPSTNEEAAVAGRRRGVMSFEEDGG